MTARAGSGRAAAAVLALLALACSTLTVPQERRLGDEMAREVRAELRLMRDPVVVGYVESIGRSIVDAAGPQPFEYRFNVVEDDEINAFAMPGGHVYVHTRTILEARNVSELAGVIAHEVGHVVERHVAENYDRQRAASIGHHALVLGAAVAGGPSAAGAANLLGGLGAISVLNSFGRDAEREADAFAVEVLPRAGYDPRGMVTFFQTLEAEGGARGPAFLSSHPATEERIEKTRRLLVEHAPAAGLRVTDGGRLEIIQQRIRLLTPRLAPRREGR
jgi:predicted Zn-dependent protease